MFRRVTALAALTLVVGTGCAAPTGGVTPQASSSAAAASSPASSPATTEGGGGVPVPTTSGVPASGADLARVDAAIEAADPQLLVTPVLSCINAKIGPSIQVFITALNTNKDETFYGGVVAVAQECGVSVHLQFGPGSVIKFIKPT
jgi:hypothetical protein